MNLYKDISFWCIICVIVVVMVIHHNLIQSDIIEGQQDAPPHSGVEEVEFEVEFTISDECGAPTTEHTGTGVISQPDVSVDFQTIPVDIVGDEVVEAVLPIPSPTPPLV